MLVVKGFCCAGDEHNGISRVIVSLYISQGVELVVLVTALALRRGNHISRKICFGMVVLCTQLLHISYPQLYAVLLVTVRSI
jgi:hypothetical protein